MATKATTRTTRTTKKSAKDTAAAGPTIVETRQQSVSHDEIARLAHRLWTERGRQHGRHQEDWFRAEQQLRGMAS